MDTCESSTLGIGKAVLQESNRACEFVNREESSKPAVPHPPPRHLPRGEREGCAVVPPHYPGGLQTFGVSSGQELHDSGAVKSFAVIFSPRRSLLCRLPEQLKFNDKGGLRTAPQHPLESALPRAAKCSLSGVVEATEGRMYQCAARVATERGLLN